MNMEIEMKRLILVLCSVALTTACTGTGGLQSGSASAQQRGTSDMTYRGGSL
jgi:hypothetical protein